MKLFGFLFVCISTVSVTAAVETQQGVRRRRLQTKSCTLTKIEIMCNGDCPGMPTWLCELQGDDAEAAHTPFVKLEGIEDSKLDEDTKVASGVTTLRVEGGEIVNGCLQIPKGAKLEYGKAEARGPAKKAGKSKEKEGRKDKKDSRVLADIFVHDIRKVLAVRVKANDRSPGSSLNEIGDKIFGTGGDVVNLVERYDSCSFGQLVMQPYDGGTTTGVSISNGVIEVAINMNVNGVENGEVFNAAVAAATARLGNLEDQFDHVMFCLPPGTNIAGWLAYAAVNSWYSVYNNDACNSPSAQMHEIGHNLNLGHAWEGTEEYGDQSGMMGYSYFEDSTKMCFNPAKSWQLGWYSDKRIELDMKADRGPFSGELIGLTDYGSNTPGKYVNIRIENGSTDFFIGFNLAAGINSSTKEGRNEVTIQSQQGSGYSYSVLLAKLAKNQAYVISNYKGNIDLNIQVNDLVFANPPFAKIDIYLDGCPPGSPCGPACGTCCDDSQCDAGDACAIGRCESDGTCSYDTRSCNGNFQMTLYTDQFAGETTWQVVDDCDNDNVVMSGGPYLDGLTTYIEEKQIGESRYTLTINDSYGDGICCGYGEGFFSATMNGLVVGSGGEFNFFESIVFGSCNEPALPTVAPTESPTKEPSRNSNWIVLFEEGFENGFGVFQNGGNNARIDTKFFNEGKASLRLRDHSDTSMATTSKAYDVFAMAQLKVDFFYFSRGVAKGERFFLEYSANGGSSWQEAKRFARGRDGDWRRNNQWYKASVEWDVSSINTSTIQLRFRADFSDLKDMVYIDNVLFEGTRIGL